MVLANFWLSVSPGSINMIYDTFTIPSINAVPHCQCSWPIGSGPYMSFYVLNCLHYYHESQTQKRPLLLLSPNFLRFNFFKDNGQTCKITCSVYRNKLDEVWKIKYISCFFHTLPPFIIGKQTSITTAQAAGFTVVMKEKKKIKSVIGYVS